MGNNSTHQIIKREDNRYIFSGLLADKGSIPNMVIERAASLSLMPSLWAM